MSFQIVGIHKNQPHMVQIHRGRDLRILFQFFPCALHFLGIMDIINSDDAFLRHPRQKKSHITCSGFKSMVGIHIDQIQSLARAIILGVINIACSPFNILQLQSPPHTFRHA